MPGIELRPLTNAEFHAWKGPAQATYAKEKEKEGLSPEDAELEARRSFASLLPHEERSHGHFIYSLIEPSSGARVGTVWWAKRKSGNRDSSWIYDITIDSAYRGRGFGRKAMQLVMEDIKRQGIANLGLHVFGHNEVAQKLYHSLGFRITNLVMQIDL